MSIKKYIAAAAITLLGAMGHAQASSVTFDSTGDSSTLFFHALQDGATIDTSIGFSLTGLTANTATFAMNVTNASSGPGQNTFMSFGIDVVSPSLTGATASGIWDAATGVTLAGAQKVDLCVYAANQCAGGAIGQGLAEGASSSFTLVLNTAGNFLSNGVTFASPFSAKWQGVGISGQSFESSGGCFGSSTGCTTTNVPEPASMALVGVALLGAGIARRRRPAAV